ncbi:MAG TPA: AbrB/MazE/SpoVT family DNA-binding domain-containing protein [Candidatus Eisenbergiella merdavium]|uniref:AbrB/MazE/SpoVT family DNA-binding domain-containing protein n=1 Tax=Candidatus Eisenbergiella merdavium TaxID=2838551 RepID=A0A9D2SPB0_9FIRM|nr:AbrB/MazE/SpoVT family DNA-binding domain-containing protein [Candidatus Eisenbergiella merdavium]
MRTAFLRACDSLGRIVIPMEIRRLLNIKEGEPLELALNQDEGQIIIERYSEMQKLQKRCQQLLQAYAKSCGGCIVITDIRSILTAKGLSYSGTEHLSEAVCQHIMAQTAYQYSPESPLPLFDKVSPVVDTLFPTGTKDNPTGAVLLLHHRPSQEKERICAQLIADTITIMITQEKYHEKHA